MAKPKPVIIIASIVGVLVVASAVVLPWYFIVYQNKPSEFPTWDLEFFGDTVDQSVNVTYEDIREEFNATTFSLNHTEWGDQSFSEIRNYTGVSLWDIIEYSGVDHGTANALRFVAKDGSVSPELSLVDVENNKSMIIVYYIEEETLLSGPKHGGNGYLMSAVNYTINESLKSSDFNLKWLVGIEFVIDWDVTLFGESPLVQENMTISYNDILTHENLTRLNTEINFTNPDFPEDSELRNVTGVTLWSIIEFTDINYTTATHIEFVASDGFSTYNVSLSDIETYTSKVLIIYEEDGELLDPSSDGYLKSLVDYSITEGYGIQRSGQYSSKFLNGIEFIQI